MIQVRYSTSPSSVETASTTQLRENYLVDGIFEPDQVHAVYTHEDRLVVGGAIPASGPLDLPAWTEVLGVDSHLQRRELGVVNVGESGYVLVDGEKFELDHLDGLYVGLDREVSFAGEGAAYYFVSAPAHAAHPTAVIRHAEVDSIAIGSSQGASERNLFKYAWGDELKTSVLQFGVTVISDGSVWNTMPPHLHPRRTEVYLYVDLDSDDRIFHVMGQPGETRHVIVENRQGVISPPWSVHAGAGTGSYAVIWAMGGENNAYTDLAAVPLEEL